MAGEKSLPKQIWLPWASHDERGLAIRAPPPRPSRLPTPCPATAMGVLCLCRRAKMWVKGMNVGFLMRKGRVAMT